MPEPTNYISELSLGAVVAVIVWVFKMKKHLKEELVDPEIDKLKAEILEMKKDRERLSEKIDKNFDKINATLDRNSKDLARMEGLLAIMAKSLKLDIPNG